jgi:hypothetical protein
MRANAPYAGLINDLSPIASTLLDLNGKSTVSELLRAAQFNGISVSGFHARSALGQVFRRIGAINSGSRPAARKSAKGVRQVIWAWPSPYKQ